MRSLMAVVVLLTPALVFAQPSISAHAGTLTHGSSVTLTVTGVGTKTQNTQLLWDTMDGTNGNSAIESRTPAGTLKWIVSAASGGTPKPTLSNVETRSTPNRTTSLFMQQTGTLVPHVGVGDDISGFLNLTAESDANLVTLPSGPLFISAWVNYIKATSTNNVKAFRWHAQDNADAPGMFWFSNPGSPTDDGVCHNRFFSVTMGEFGDGEWHQVKHLFHWSTETYHRVYFDNELVVDTDPPGEYNAPGGGFTEGPWGDLDPGDQIDNYVFESQGNATGGISDELYYLSDAYFDSGYSRVELCNANTYAGSNHCEMQPYTAWPNNNGSLTITLNRGTFAADAAVYLYAINASDTPSSGYAVTLGTGGGGAIAPARLRRPDVLAALPVALFLWRRRRHSQGR